MSLETFIGITVTLVAVALLSCVAVAAPGIIMAFGAYWVISKLAGK